MMISAYALDFPSLNGLNYTLAIIGLLGIPLAIWRSKSRKRLTAAADAILGAEAVTDASGKEITPSHPGLVHRVAQVEEAVVEFRHVVGLLTETQKRIDRIEHRVAALEDSRVKDIVTSAERAATAAASAEMLRLATERDVIDGHADETSGEL